MKASLWPFGAVFLCLLFGLAGCGTVPDHTKLQNGMSREMVLEVMGKPDTSTVSDGIETLEYKTVEWHQPANENSLSSSTIVSRVRLRNGIVVSSRKFTESSSRLGAKFSDLGITEGRIVTSSNTPNASRQKITILSVLPDTAKPGVHREFIVRVAYSFQSLVEGEVTLMFNINSNTKYKILGRRMVSPGSGIIEYTVTVKPKEWVEGIPFSAKAYLTINKTVVSSSWQEIKLMK